MGEKSAQRNALRNPVKATKSATWSPYVWSMNPPMASSAVLFGRSMSDLLGSVLGLGVLLACSLVAGWRPHNSPAETLGAFGLLPLLAVTMNCVGVVLGLLVRIPEVVNILGGMLLLLAMFLSNIFVPTQGMPTWLQTIAAWNPLSATVAACRALFGNPGAAQVSTAWSLLAVLAPMAIRFYRTATTRWSA
jgi:ABC-2 type transport system permease protein